jgi:hypothetical protein
MLLKIAGEWENMTGKPVFGGKRLNLKPAARLLYGETENRNLKSRVIKVYMQR